jgi:hypothetical protein
MARSGRRTGATGWLVASTGGSENSDMAKL